MVAGSQADRARSAESDSDAERARGRASSREPSLIGSAAARALLGLQRGAGNAAVVQMLQRGALPAVLRLSNGGAASIPGVAEPGAEDVEPLTAEERQAEEARNIQERQAAEAGGPDGREAAEARAAGATAEGGAAEPEPNVDPDEKHPPEERAAKLAEPVEGPTTDEGDSVAFGPPPQAGGERGGARFVDHGRQGSVPFTDAAAAELEGGPDGEPHAFTAGGKTGSIAWAGGTYGKGPKGNQPSGLIDPLTPPLITGEWGGLMSRANAWVAPGTGIADVERSYMTSASGDQGTGWWVSPKAAAKLEQHEGLHVKKSLELYENDIAPALDRVAKSAVTGKAASYFLSDAKKILRDKLEFWPAVQSFVEWDKSENGKMGSVDQADLRSGTYPRERGHVERDQDGNLGPEIPGGKVDGKDFDHLLQAPDEPIREQAATGQAPAKP